MPAEPTLCSHLCAEEVPGLAIRPNEIIEWHDGPIVAAVRCPKCDACALLEILDWDGPRGVRIFALRPLSRAALDLYLRDVERGSCDPARAKSELHAFLSAAGAPTRLVAYDTDARALVANRAFPAGEVVSSDPWTERIPAPDDLRWFNLAGVAKRRGDGD